MSIVVLADREHGPQPESDPLKQLFLESSRNNLNTHPPTQDREKDSEFEWNDQESGGSVWIDPRVSWCGDRDGDTNSQCTPALHYTGYIVQTVCQY